MKIVILKLLWFIAVCLLIVIACFAMLLTIDMINVTIKIIKERLNK